MSPYSFLRRLLTPVCVVCTLGLSACSSATPAIASNDASQTPDASPASSEAGDEPTDDASSTDDAGLSDPGTDANATADSSAACSTVSCNGAPATYCVDTTTLRSYAATGTCAAGLCTYAHSDSVCAHGCQGGACQGADPCSGVVCGSPPSPSCTDPSTLETYSSSGTCAAGQCSYSATSTHCPTGCQGGACLGNPCAGVSCNQPPASTCVANSTLRTYSPAGTCAQGTCSYGFTDTTCSNGCAGNACTADPCAGVTCAAPPAPSCLSASVRLSYASTGTCQGGTCSYIATQTTCASGCTAGSCNADPCAGVTCTTPPAPYCASATTLETFSASGTCSTGACSYASTQATCAYGCASGACAAAPCGGTCAAGTVCGPANTCVVTPAAPQLVTPLSTSVNPSRPVFHWITATTADDSRIELCRDRACTKVVLTLTGTTGASLSSDLTPGSYFYRGFGRRTVGGALVEGPPGAVWELFVNHAVRAGASSAVASPDFNGDGIVDLGVVNGFPSSGTANLGLYSSPGGASYQMLSTSSSGTFASSTITAGDLDGDGYVDLVTLGSVGAIDYSTTPPTYPKPDLLVYFGSPTGLGATQRLTLQRSGVLLDVQPIGDADGDGHADIVVFQVVPPAPPLSQSSSVSATIVYGGCVGPSLAPGSTVACGLQAGTLLYGGLTLRTQTTVLTTALQSSYAPRLEVIGDVNGDGLRDLAMAQSLFPPTIEIHLATGSGFAAAPGLVLSDYQQLTPIGDFNGDGYGDVVVARNAESASGSPSGVYTVVPAPVALLGGKGGLSLASAVVLNYPTTTPPTGTAASSCFATPGSTNVVFSCFVVGGFHPVGDINGDGSDDLGMTGSVNVAPTGTFPWRTFEHLFVYDGSAAAISPDPGQQLVNPDDAANLYDSYFGDEVCAPGDVDGDGIDDIGITAAGWHSPSRSLSDLPPKVRLWTGSASGPAAQPGWTLVSGQSPVYNDGFGELLLSREY